MKRFSFLAIMLTVFCLSANAQEGKSPRTIIAATDVDILYEGISNTLYISVDGIADSNIDAGIDSYGYISKIGNGEYKVNVHFLEGYTSKDFVDKDGTFYKKGALLPRDRKINIYLYSNINNERVYLTKKSFNVFELKKPKAVVAKSDGGLIDKYVLLNNPYVKTVSEGFSPVDFKVVDFIMIFDSDKEKDAPQFAKGDEFTPEMIARIKTLKKGDKIYIEGISVIMNGVPTPVENPTMIFTIE